MIYDYLTALDYIVRQVKLTRNDHDSPQGRDLLTSRIGALFVGTDDDPANIPTLGTGHQSKGLEWETVYILEPALMMLQKIVERGGLAAEDEAHVICEARDGVATSHAPRLSQGRLLR